MWSQRYVMRNRQLHGFFSAPGSQGQPTKAFDEDPGANYRIIMLSQLLRSQGRRSRLNGMVFNGMDGFQVSKYRLQFIVRHVLNGHH